MADTVEKSEAASTDQWSGWRGRLAASRKRRDEKIGTWQENVSKRIKSPDSAFSSGSAEVSVNQDWPKTTAKIAGHFSQTPEVRVSPRQGMEQFQPLVQTFTVW